MKNAVERRVSRSRAVVKSGVSSFLANRSPVAVAAIPPSLPAVVRGRWISKASYTPLRNAAWFVRNYRMVGHDDAAAVAQLTHEVRVLLDSGEPLESVVPSLADLFLRS